jgi:Protein of unknown function (DUF2971)
MPTSDTHRAVFFPYATRKRMEFQFEQRSFVYYTTAATALRALCNREIWMRLTGVMNDHSEVQHGINCLNSALASSAGQQLESALNSCFPGLYQEVLNQFHQWVPNIFADTFITCISEHEQADREYGKLSMWRAYGGNAGVALVLNPYVFFSETQALAAYTSPVLYANADGLQARLVEVAQNILGNTGYVQSIGRENARGSAFHALRFGAICTKHPAFKEEREWRIASSPSMQRSDYVKQFQEVIGDVPQPVLKIKLEDQPDEGLIGLQPQDFIEQVLIGPCEFPSIIARSFAEEMQQRGFANPWAKIKITGIPLRPNQR